MRKRRKKRSRKAGLLPGTLVHIGEKKVESTRITLMDFGWKKWLRGGPKGPQTASFGALCKGEGPCP